MILEYTVTMTVKTHSDRAVDEMSASLLTPVMSQEDPTGTNPNTNPNVASTRFLWFRVDRQGCQSIPARHYQCEVIQGVITQTSTDPET